MDISADVAAIVGQASDWNFAGDCALLELMKRISQNLHERGEQTSRNFREFETKVRRVDIALDNATNSLRSLQFGQQFVEYRVEEVDDDDFVLPEEQQKKPELPLKSSQELAAEFLQNNLQMFRKNFEAVTIELTDSDEEDGTVNATTVYRAKNPYDSIPLPYVIGSKEWQEHKYAGLYDSTENSEDEQPEQFSSSSSDELETAAPKATPVHQAQHSDSSSLASLPKEMPAQNQATPAARPVPQPGAQTVPQTVPQPVPQPRPIISMHRNPHESDMFAALRASPPSDDPPSSSASSLNSSPAVSHANAAATGLSSSSSSASKVVIQAGRQSPPKLFDEAVPVVPAATPIDVPSAVKPTPAAASQIKRKPVNLFNDDEFNSFMSEIVEKVQSKSGNGSTPPATVAKSKNMSKESPAPQEVKPVAPPRKPIETPQRSLNLFEDSPPLSPNLRPATSTAHSAKTLPTSLFDDNLDDDVDDFLSSFTAKAKPQQQKPKTTLFDDDDDLDIDDIFAKKTPTVQPTKLASKIVSKSSLFDDDVDDVENAHDIFGTSSIKAAEKQPQETKVAPVLPPAREPPGAPRSLFDDLGDDDLFGTPKTKKPSPYAGAEKKQLSETKRLVEEAPPADVAPANQVVEQQLPEQAEHIGDQAKKLEQQIPQASQDLPDEAPAILKAQLPISKVDLFSEDFSDEEAVVSSSSHTTRDLKEITTTGELLPEPTNKAKEDQVEPENKDKVELVSNNEEQHQVKPALLGDLLKNIKDSSATTIAEEDELEEEEPPADQQQQDPIISLVAEQTKKSTHSHAPADVAAAQQIMQNYSSLFSDEPPDDSEFFQSLGTSSLSSLSATKMFDSEQDFYEPSLPDLPPAAAATVEQPNNDYGGMRLFSDEPPDDDEDEEDEKEKATAAAKQPDAAAPKRIHTIFYDDFSETTRAGAVQQAKSAIFAEEPPPADAVEPKPGSPIKKLQMPNININVQALLPGSGALPKPPKKLEEAVAPSAAPVSQVAISSSSEADNILQCISKTRVRGPAHRRPSTRRARQANYAKSLLEAQPEPIPASSTSPSAATSTTASLSSKSAGVPSFESDDNEEDDALFKAFRAQAAAPQESSQAATSKPALFLDCDADDDALFDKTLARKAEKMPAATAPAASPATAPVAPPATATVTAPPGDSPIVSPAIAPVAPSTTPAVAMLTSTQPPEDDLKPFAKSASFLDSDEDDDDSNSFLFSPSATQTPAQYANRGTSRAPAGPPKSYVSFLDNNDEDEDAMFAAAATRSAATAAAVPTAMPSQKPAKDELKSTAKSAFLDSDDDDDDDALFQPSKLKTQPQLVEPKSSKVLAPAPASVALDKSKPKPVKSKLFDDSDDDDDNLFGSAVASVTKAQPAATPAAAATLFASSSEEESEQKPPKPLATKAKLPTKPAKSLFSDDDDDDDLFGGGAAPGAKRAAASSQAKPVPKKAASKTTTATPLQASKTDGADNPLADLLGP